MASDMMLADKLKKMLLWRGDVLARSRLSIVWRGLYLRDILWTKRVRKCHVSLTTGERAKPAKCVVAVYRTVRRVGWSDTH